MGSEGISGTSGESSSATPTNPVQKSAILGTAKLLHRTHRLLDLWFCLEGDKKTPAEGKLGLFFNVYAIHTCLFLILVLLILEACGFI